MAILPSCRSWWYRYRIHLPTLGTLVQRGHSWRGRGVLSSSIALSNNECQSHQNLPGQQFNHVSGLDDDIRIPAFPENDSLWNSLILIWTPKPSVIKTQKSSNLVVSTVMLPSIKSRSAFNLYSASLACTVHISRITTQKAWAWWLPVFYWGSISINLQLPTLKTSGVCQTEIEGRCVHYTVTWHRAVSNSKY